MPNIVVAQGAMVAIGLTRDIVWASLNVLTETFCMEMLKGKTVSEAMAIACAATDPSNDVAYGKYEIYEPVDRELITVNDVKIVGNANYRLFE